MKKEKLVYGFGINDVDYAVQIKVDVPSTTGKRQRKLLWMCPYYKKWFCILERCYSERFLTKRPTYRGCYVDESWRRLSDFIKWVDSQPNKNWEHCEPDKDILEVGNRCYGPNTVVFVTRDLNLFIGNDKYGKDTSVGYYWHKLVGKYQSLIQNPFTKQQERIGWHTDPLEAHLSWKSKKHEYACKLADLQSDERIATALRNRYKPD